MQITKAFSILAKLADQSAAVQILFTPEYQDFEGEPLAYSALLESLRVLVEIKSLPEPTIPPGIEDQGRIEALQTYRAYAWTGPRYHLNLMRKKTGDWVKVATVPLIARGPFHHIDLLPYLTRQVVARLAGGDTIGVQVEDAGYGLPTALDRLVVMGEGLLETDIPLDVAIALAEGAEGDGEGGGGGGGGAAVLPSPTTANIILPATAFPIGESEEQNYGLPRAEKDELGFVHLFGRASFNVGGFSQIDGGTLPEGYRPSHFLDFPMANQRGKYALVVQPFGQIWFRRNISVSSVNAEDMSYSGVVFRAGNN